MRLGHHHSPEARSKMSATQRGRMKARSIEQEVARGAKISATMKGRPGHPQTPEARAKMSIAKKGTRGPLNNSWKGGRYITSPGNYVYIFNPHHLHANLDGYVLEHRLIMETHLKRILLPSEIVHHINGDRKDNRIENLMLFASNGKHTEYHCKKRREL